MNVVTLLEQYLLGVVNKMKQVVVINNNLKMKKGKMARVCLNLGDEAYNLIGWVDRITWKLLGKKGVVCKTDEYQEVLNYLREERIKYKCHVDAGRTGVKPNSNCGVVFFMKEEDNFIDTLKLV